MSGRASSAIEAMPSPYAQLRQAPEPGDDQGKRHPLAAMLALAGVALLCGDQTPKAISEYVDNYGKRYLNSFGFTRDEPPGQATEHRVRCSIDWEVLEARVTGWVRTEASSSS